MDNTKQIIQNGFWTNNVGLVQLLGLCPLLAVSATAINGLGLGLATTATLVLSNTIVALIRDVVRDEVRIPIFVLVIASIVTVIELTMHAWFFELYKVLGIFIPLIVTNCAIIGRAEAFASKNSVKDSVIDALAMGLGFAILLVVLGSMRELIGQGTLFANADIMFGAIATDWTLTLGDDYPGFLLAILPPGAFIGLGLLIAVKNVIDDRNAKRAAEQTTPAQPVTT